MKLSLLLVYMSVLNKPEDKARNVIIKTELEEIMEKIQALDGTGLDWIMNPAD